MLLYIIYQLNLNNYMNQGLLIIPVFQMRRLKHGEVFTQSHTANEELHWELDSSSDAHVFNHDRLSASQDR